MRVKYPFRILHKYGKSVSEGRSRRYTKTDHWFLIQDRRGLWWSIPTRVLGWTTERKPA